MCYESKTHILCFLAGMVPHDCTQYKALTEVAQIKGWSYLSDYEVFSLSEVCLSGARKGENENNLIVFIFYLNYITILI